MKSLRFLLAVALLPLSTLTFAQSDAHSDAHKSAVAPVQSDAQKAFTQLKTLAGAWRGPITADPPQGDWDNKPISLSMRVTSRGNLLVHEMKEPGTPDDPSKD